MPEFSHGKPSMDELLTPAEVAERLKVTRKSVYRWVASGRLRSVKIGSSVRIYVSSIEDTPEAHSAN